LGRELEALAEALEAQDGLSGEHLAAHENVERFPADVAALAAYDALIVSDLSHDTLLPHFRPEEIPGPNRLRVIADYVREGGGLVYCGGWMSFQGYHGIGNWAESPVAELLPVETRNVFDDRVERPEGVSLGSLERGHSVTEGLDWAAFPPLYGYNRVGDVREDAEELATVDGDPLLAVREAGDGRALAYTSDPGPKWGLELAEWSDYPAFWRGALEWVTGNR
jgi:uncharacterized membrane protein